MSKLQKEEKEAEEAAARPPPSAPSPATSATLSDSTKSKEGSATYDKSGSAELAKKGSYSLEKCMDMCATPPVKQQRHDEAPDSAPKKTMSHQSLKESSAVMVEEAWGRLKKSFVYYRGKPVAILAATDPMAEALNYNQMLVTPGYNDSPTCFYIVKCLGLESVI
ncbi:putative beta-fructofuranosidase [Rosa chinensis]|uniref:Putative beta-fructofuranosidase n=1 Tax=Rosa chinensis TaxID=74649 RepID=A0A2P6RG81_ROSCH|nr:putative beta-fructofuranosidase [Rosa chinensis]